MLGKSAWKIVLGREKSFQQNAQEMLEGRQFGY
jgi:hypothetical protein